jgi:hypothetical protein
MWQLASWDDADQLMLDPVTSDLIKAILIKRSTLSRPYRTRCLGVWD